MDPVLLSLIEDGGGGGNMVPKPRCCSGGIELARLPLPRAGGIELARPRFDMVPPAY
jgi:hypothetical protein